MKNSDSDLPPINYSALDDLGLKKHTSSEPQRQIPSGSLDLNLRSIPSYRQRLTALGWAGLALLIICPAWLSILFSQMFTARNSFQQPNTGLMVIVAIGATVAPVLILIGREYYPTRTRPSS